MRRMTGFVVVLVFLAGCALGPNYQRPGMDIPVHYRSAMGHGFGDVSLGDQQWPVIFRDKPLQDLIIRALSENSDLLIAADHVLEAQAQLNITGSYQYPTITAQGIINGQRYEKIRTASPYTLGTYQVSAGLSWDLDFWGKYRRMIEASKANFLASAWARRVVVTSLIAEVAEAYFELRELDLELSISKRTLGSRQESLKLINALASHGAASLLDVHQAQVLLYSAAENIPVLESRIQQKENLLSILIGNNPGPIERDKQEDQHPHWPDIPAGIPSLLLERRADIRQAEEELRASNAQIGVAQGAYFPDISLTATGGYQSAALSKLFMGPSGMWDIGTNLTQPIFNAGRLRAGVKLARAQQQEALHVYIKTIREAFREVADALVAYQKMREATAAQAMLTESAQKAAALSALRYKGGMESYLEVLDSDTRYFAAQLALAQDRLSQWQSLVNLYKALGGGWLTTG